MVGYIRQDTGNNIANGETIDATYLDQEFDALVAAFHASTGHVHDGTVGNGSPITGIGPALDIVATSSVLRPKTNDAYDLGTTALRFKDGYFSGDLFVTDDITADDFIGDLTGNVIGNVTGNITGNVTGNLTGNVTGDVTGDVTGNVATATALETARTIGLSGVTATAQSFDGTANITIPITAVPASLLTGTIASARIDGSYTQLTGTGALTAGSITTSFGAINIGSSNITGGVITGNFVVGGDGTSTSSAIQLQAKGDTVAGVRIETATNGSGFLTFYDGANSGRIVYDHTVDKMSLIASGGSATAWVTNTGFMVGTDSLIVPTNNEYGCSFSTDGLATISRNGDIPLRIKRGGSDGTLVQFYQGTTVEGTISVSGGTVSYGTFLGVHWSDGVENLLPGTVLETIDEVVFKNYLPKVKVSDTEASRRVYGVYQCTNEDKVHVASLGAWMVRVSGVVEGGDLLESAGDGTARKQTGDTITSSTIGKVTANVPAEIYPDGSYLIPAVLYCG